MGNPDSHNLLSLRQAAQLIGRSYRVLCNYIDQRRVEYLQIDHIRLVTQDEIDRVIKEGIIAEPKKAIDGYKTIIQAAKILSMNTATLKNYVKKEKIDSIKEQDIYFIPDETVAMWLKVPEPKNPNTVEAYYLDAVTIKKATLLIGCCDSIVRQLIKKKQLSIVNGCYGAWYVTMASVNKYIEIQEMLNEL